MYQVPPPKEPNGCLQAAVISRMIAGILLVPLGLIFGGILALVFAFYAFAEHALLGFALLLVTVLVLSVISRWEYVRVKRELPPPDEVDPADPRLR